MVDGSPVGVRPDGTPFLVHASAAPEYARGAIYGLVAGATFLREGVFADTVPPVVEHAGHLAASLMTRGRFVVEDFANRLEGAHPDPANLPVLILPLALFHASEGDERRAAIEALAAFSGADRPTVLAAHAMAGAIAAGTFDLAEPYDMAVAAVVALDGCEPGAARDLLRAELRRAVESEVDPGADVSLHLSLRASGVGPHLSLRPSGVGPHLSLRPSGVGPHLSLRPSGVGPALGRAVWYLLSNASPAVALSTVCAQEVDALVAMSTAILLGAAEGAEAWPKAWREALTPLAAPLLTLVASAP